MDILSFTIILACILLSPLKVAIAVDSIGVSVSQSLSDGMTLVSQGGKFELGFFSPGNPRKRYLGIRYKNIPIPTVVWVANRANPIYGFSGTLTMNNTGNLVLRQNDSVIWHRTSQKHAQNPVAELLDSGNLVVRNDGEANPEAYLWQSFDYPADTYLPGMKIGRDLKNGLDWRLTSWKSPDDPSPGDLSWGLALSDYPEFSMMNGTEKFSRIGPWNGLYFSGLPNLKPDSVVEFSYVANKDEIFYTSSSKDDSVISRVVINQTSGVFNRYVWVEKDQNWNIFESLPSDVCDNHGLCGANGYCITTQSQICQCLEGFGPKSPQAWNSSNWAQGCVCSEPLSCSFDDGFLKYTGLKVPDTTHTRLNVNINLEECGVLCLNNCCCMAYTNSAIRGKGSGCVMWFGDLIDIKKYEDVGQDLYIRMAASELELQHQDNKKLIVAITIAVICGMLLLCIYAIYKVRRNIADQTKGKLLEWPQCFHIISGVVRGLMYLHQDSILRIIHRDLKAINILFDVKLNPKISYFGMAKAFGGDQTEGNTNRVVGTCGYMAPEYAIDGSFSIKSDVFSFGISLMEIICGTKNRALCDENQTYNLVGYAWRLWKEDKALQLIDPNIKDSGIISEVMRCIHVSLLCVQQYPEDRPTMTSVLLMLGSEKDLVEPKEPGFFPRRVSTEANLHSHQNDMRSNGEITVTLLDGR